MRVLVIDIGGSDVKVFANNQRYEIPSGPGMTPQRLLPEIRKAINGWRYDAVSIGYPGRVRRNALEENAPNLGKGWVGYNFRKAFRKPVKLLNDAAMQALGSYQGGRMLFLGLGTGLGSALILEGVVHAMEIGDLSYDHGNSYADILGKDGLKRLGKAKWSRHVLRALKQLTEALQVDYVVLGGGKAKLIPRLPPKVIKGGNSKAFDGGVRAWKASLGKRGPKLVFA
jgi:predicted NBD/HSP70 family sugar kinase